MLIKFQNPLNGRFYYMRLYKDLLGDIFLMVSKGSKKKKISQFIPYDNEEKIIDEICHRAKIRLKRGYDVA